MPFEYSRTIHFHETDAAGVVYFAHILTLCHEAYEASLAAVGIDLRRFFSSQLIALPVVHAEARFHKPMFCGDVVAIQLVPTLMSPNSFEIAFQVLNPERESLANAKTRHLCIETATRSRQPLTDEVAQWLQRWQSI